MSVVSRASVIKLILLEFFVCWLKMTFMNHFLIDVINITLLWFIYHIGGGR